MDKNQLNFFYNLGVATIRELETERGILASSNKELFGFVFGRDSCITALKLLYADEKSSEKQFLPLVRKILVGLASLQGKEINIESGEEPGKIVHDYRESGHELLTRDLPHPWYVYPDGVMRSFDSLDSTPLFLMTAARYLNVSRDTTLFEDIGAHIRQALVWILDYADTNGDGFIDYRMHPDRKHGGLYVQNWMDHETSLYHEDGTPVAMPVAPVEVQAYAYAGLRAWADHYVSIDPAFSERLRERAGRLKKLFNERYPVESSQGFFLASGIDGAGKQIEAVRSSMGHVLWAALRTSDGKRDGILDERYVAPVVKRLLQPDLFEPHAGIRTVSAHSVGYAPDGYHHGAIWPHDTSIVAEGLENFGFIQEARVLREALFEAYAHYKTPLELFVYDGEYKEFWPSYRDPACKTQAWSAAAMVADAASLPRA